MAQKFCIVLAFSLILSAPVLAADGAMSFTLQEAVRQGIHTSPEHDIVTSQRNAAHQRLLQANALYLPSVDLALQAGREKVFTSPNVDTQALWQRRGSLTLTQLLFDGWGTTNEIKSQKHRLESAERRVKAETEFLGLDVVQAYLDILRQRDLLKIARTNVDNHHRIFKKIQAGVDAGTMADGDAAQAESRLNSAHTNVSSVEQNLRSAEALFINKVGAMPGDLAPPDFPRHQLPLTLNLVLQDARAYSPTLAVYQSDVNAAVAEWRGASSAFYPRMNLEINGSKSIDEGGFTGNQEDFSALVVMRWNLLRGGGDTARRQEFMYRYAESKARAAAALRQVESEVRDTWAAKDSAFARSQEYLRQSKASERVVSVYLDQFTLNRRSLLDVLDAENELFASRSNHLHAFYAEKFAVYRLLAIQGKMLAVLGVEPPREIQRGHY